MYFAYIYLTSFLFMINCTTRIENPKKFMSDVIIDLYGNYKYILIEMSNKTNLNDYKYLVRGSTAFDYHKSLYRNFDGLREPFNSYEFFFQNSWRRKNFN